MKRGAQAWILTAREDLETARLVARNALWAPAAFHSQQAAEKAIRALLLEHHVEAREHSLVELLDMVSRQLGLDAPPAVLTAARKLDPHYIQARYPGPHGPRPATLYDEAIIQELLGCVEELFQWVESHLST